MSDGTSRRIDDIEVLRAVAILFVLVEHFRFNLFPWPVPLYEHLQKYFQFWSGVDIFFAISGFVIARSLLPSLDATGDRNAYFNAAIVFWVKRFWRLTPSAWLWLFVILIATLFFNQSGAFGSFRTNFDGVLAAILNVANFHVAMNYGVAPLGPSFPYWSLSLEEQFYILLPFVVLLSGRRLPYVLAAIVLSQLFLARGNAIGNWVLVLNQTRSDALAMGVLIAMWSNHPTYRLFEPFLLSRSRSARIIMLCLPLTSIAALTSNATHIAFFYQGLIALLSAMLVFIASYDQDYLWKDGVTKRVLLWIGSRSYALYLIHMPAYCATRELFFRFAPLPAQYSAVSTARLIAVAAILLFALAELNYRFVETPLRRHGAAIAERLRARVPQNAADEPAAL